MDDGFKVSLRECSTQLEEVDGVQGRLRGAWTGGRKERAEKVLIDAEEPVSVLFKKPLLEELSYRE